MAKSKKKELSYLQSPLPHGQKTTRIVKVDWSGLNYRQTMDTGSLSYEKNLSTNEAPYLTPSGKFEEVLDFGEVYGCEIDAQTGGYVWSEGKNIVSTIYGYEGLLFVLYYKNESSAALNVNPYAAAYNAAMQEIKIGNSNADRKIGKTQEILSLPPMHAAAFAAMTGSNIASTGRADIKKKILFFPGNYSLEMKRIIDVPYKRSYRHSWRKDCLYPWEFIESFTDKDVIYNVVKNPGYDIPIYSNLTWDGFGSNPNVKSFSAYLSYQLTDDSEENESWILGFWSWQNNCWAPLGYNSDTKTKNNTLDAETETFSTTDNPCPVFNDTAVFQSRLFGIDEAKVYASKFNEYCGWTLDTADDSNSANAWISALNANPNADGDLTAITAYQDRVIVFRENYMYEIRNTKNPFRVVDIFQEGCINSRAVCVVKDKLIFTSRNGVLVYTGTKPADIGHNLNVKIFKYAVCGTDGRKFYLYCQTDAREHNLFVYDNLYGQWSEMEIDKKVLCFTHNDCGMFMLTGDNKIYRLNEENFDHEWAAETDFYTGGTIDLKHIRKIQIYADAAADSNIRVYILYDGCVFGDGFSENAEHVQKVYEFENNTNAEKRLTIRVLPRKSACYGYKIRIEGHGRVKVYQMELELTGGGELFNDGI